MSVNPQAFVPTGYPSAPTPGGPGAPGAAEDSLAAVRDVLAALHAQAGGDIGITPTVAAVVPTPTCPLPTQTSFYKNPVAVMGYLAQVLGLLMVVLSMSASIVGVLPGLPPSFLAGIGTALAVVSKVSLDLHSAQVRVAELQTSTYATLGSPPVTPPIPAPAAVPPAVPSAQPTPPAAPGAAVSGPEVGGNS